MRVAWVHVMVFPFVELNKHQVCSLTQDLKELSKECCEVVLINGHMVIPLRKDVPTIKTNKNILLMKFFRNRLVNSKGALYLVVP